MERWADRGHAGTEREDHRRSTGCAKFWAAVRGTDGPILRRAKIEDMILAAREEHPRSAKNELEFLKRVLHDAKGRGQRVDEAIFEIPPVRHRPRGVER